jgi:hypothetical protein
VNRWLWPARRTAVTRGVLATALGIETAASVKPIPTAAARLLNREIIFFFPPIGNELRHMTNSASTAHRCLNVTTPATRSLIFHGHESRLLLEQLGVFCPSYHLESIMESAEAGQTAQSARTEPVNTTKSHGSASGVPPTTNSRFAQYPVRPIYLTRFALAPLGQDDLGRILLPSSRCEPRPRRSGAATTANGEACLSRFRHRCTIQDETPGARVRAPQDEWALLPLRVRGLERSSFMPT